ncbi:E3 ubiquitin-protein ligase tom1 [Recurvomyces mirabilis]|nr:E3 ubiquitin-protein ligase tom1 [Recurvomyces mirabilis]
MGRIKKVASERHTATLSPFIEEYVTQATSTPLHRLPQKLAEFPQQWPFPRGDLYHWIPLLNRFDHVLELFVKEYDLHDGPQTQPFKRQVLQNGDAEEGLPYPTEGAKWEELDSVGYSEEGDRELVESILYFSRLLHERCGNRSLYASSGHINDLLHTTSLSLLRLSLKLALRLAQRYQVARYKGQGSHNTAKLMAENYNINLDNLQKLAMPFPKPTSSSSTGVQPVTPGKGKDKVMLAQTFNPSDLVTIAKEPSTLGSKGDLGSVNMSFYNTLQHSSTISGPSTEPTEASPSTPTPARRTSILGPSRDRPTSDNSEEMPDTPSRSRQANGPDATAPKVFHITSTNVAESPSWALVRQGLPNVPSEMRYDLLNRIRIAKVFASPDLPTQALLEIRLLAIANLSFALSESKFQEKIGIPDNEEPRRFHLAQQLCDLLQPATNGQAALSLELETVVVHTIEALLKSRHKITEVIDTLSINVNHGILYYELRKVIATLASEEHDNVSDELHELEWREATFDLIHNLQIQQAQPRVGERLVSAGIMSILIEVLSLRTSRAERFKERVLSFFASFIHNIQTAMQTFATDKGFDILADLTQYEVETTLAAAQSGNGLPAEYKSKVVDYEIPFYQQSTLRQLLKFVVQMFDSHNAGTHDRLLRNFVDTPQILASLKAVIENWKIFGSNVWTSGVNIMSAFIHNEPTSYQVVGEAGLPRILLETITDQKLPEEIPTEFEPTAKDLPVDIEFVDGAPQWPTISGILPVEQTMSDVPGAFGAICLNENGMALFQASKVLIKYFDIFVSPLHVKALVEDDLMGNSGAANIGQAFDELARHQPRLKDLINMSVCAMVKRVAKLSRNMARHRANGAKLWVRSADGFEVEGGRAAVAGATQVGTPDSEVAEIAMAERTVRDADFEDAEKVEALRFTAACIKFLEGFLSNSGMCALFCETDGAEWVLDLVTSPSNPVELGTFAMYKSFSNVLKAMCESKAHLVLPSLLRRLENALGVVMPTMEQKLDSHNGLFQSFVKVEADHLPFGHTGCAVDGTTLLKCMSSTQILTDLLGKVLSPPTYTSRHSVQSNQLFTNLNFTDVYLQLVEQLSILRSNCLWESLALEASLSQELKDTTSPQTHKVRRVDVNNRIELTSYNPAESSTNGNSEKATRTPEEYVVKNVSQLRYVLVEATSAISRFEQHLAQALVPRRTTEIAQKQHASLVADKLATSALTSLEYVKYDSLDKGAQLKYVAGLIQMLQRMMFKQSFQVPGEAKEALTLVMNKFYLAGGFEKLNQHLAMFGDVIAETKGAESEDPRTKPSTYGLNAILDFYALVVRQKTINEAHQSGQISSRHHQHADYFMPGQFVVELRYTILPAVSKLWYSPAIETMGDQCVKKVIDIVRQIIKADGEDKAIKRSEKASRRVETNEPDFSLRNLDHVASVQQDGVDPRLAREAIYRCNNAQASAREYAQLRTTAQVIPRFPIPQGEPAEGEVPDPPPVAEQGSDAMIDNDAETELPSESQASESNIAGDSTESEDENPGTLGHLPADLLGDAGDQDLMAMIGAGRMQDILNLASNGGSSTPPGGPPFTPPSKDTGKPFTTIEDLDEKRQAFKDALIDRCLEVLSAAPGVTFELSDLIQAAVGKSGQRTTQPYDIASTLVSSLMSLQSDEQSKEAGLKLAAYAHLVALILQDRDFFDSTLEELKEYLDTLVGWVRLQPEQKTEDAPWLEMVLLIIERMLSEDEQPVELNWEPPPPDDPLQPLAEPTLPEPVVPQESRDMLFDALIDILPKIGKNDSLALSVTRVLVMLTRRRETALRLSEKQSMHRLFLMVRQLAGRGDEKLYSSFMLVLRHMIEDEACLRQIMRTEIKAVLENGRQSRITDTSSFTRSLYYLVLRDPKIFVEITGELVEIGKFDGNPNRAQSLVLKKEKAVAQPEEKVAESASAEAKPTNGDDAEPAVQKSTEPAAEDKSAEPKAPVVDSPDGVMAFLLRELSNYKDVEERPALPSKDSQAEGQATADANVDVDMADVSASASQAPTGTPQIEAAKTADKPAFKAEEHSIYIYRCFLLECLSELLSSYTRTKVEFINFSRKPETQPATPVKPRAGTLHYLLNQLVPVGTLEHKDDIAHRKKLSTSNWATTVLVALTAKTPETGSRSHRTVEVDGEENADLVFVRKFVLEHALRSFKEATTSNEPLDQRYSRMLALGELFNRMLNKSDRDASPLDPGHKQQLGRLMYEKGYVGALTSAIAELDLNFPNAKRAVKYILGPLRQLTDLGVELSQTSDLSSSSAHGASTEEDDDSSTTATSDDDDDREQTPDLLRNTTLGMLESGATHDEDSSEDDDEDDEDMEDYEEYDEMEGMEYEEDEAEHGDVVSDEDEEEVGVDGMGEIEGRPGDIEIVMEGDEDDDEEDDDEDEDDEEIDEDGEFHEHLDEITGDDENASMADGDEGEWEEDDEMDAFAAEAGQGGSPHGGPLDHIAQVLDPDLRSETGEEHDHDHIVRVDVGDGPEDYFEDEMPPEDEDEEDEEIDYDGEVAFEPEIEDDEDEDMWGISGPNAGAFSAARHDHHHHHGGGGLRTWGGMVDMLEGTQGFRAPGMRTHRPVNQANGEDGRNPLLQRASTNMGQNGDDGNDNPLTRLGNRHGARAFPPVDLIQDLVAQVGANGHGTISVNIGDMAGMRHLPGMFSLQGGAGRRFLDIDPSRPWHEQIQPRFGDMAGMRGANDVHRSGGNEEARAVEFQIHATIQRWQEEARMLFASKHQEKALRINSTLLRMLMPPAMQARLEHEKAETERRALEEKAKEEERKKLETEQAEQAEREAQDKKEREEEEEARTREEDARHAQDEARVADEMADETADEMAAEMEGVESTQPEIEPEASPASAVTAPAEPEQPVERVMTTIRGREVDITSLGIDREFLDAIPEDMREEVIMQQLQEQRTQAAQTGEQPTEISREFLDALPREIQQELIRQEQSERRRRDRQEARQRIAQEAGAQPAQPEEMNNADFMAMLDPHLRQTILMDTDENTLAALPEEVQAEARALLGDRIPPRMAGGANAAGAGGAGLARREAIRRHGERPLQELPRETRQRRPIVQMLDKAGIATLLRLMFVSLHHKAKTNLYSILSDVSKNTQNRAEVISILLSILQDGTADVGAVERSFAQLSLKARQQQVGPKTPQPLKRTPTGLAAAPTTELSPLNIVHHCLTTLRTLAEDNTKVPSFFLTEHETATAQKTKTPKKGKGRESKASKYPLNALLALLDRKLITENTGVMETLATLLSRVTQPLTILSRRPRDPAPAVPDAESAQEPAAEAPQVSLSGDVAMEEAPAAIAESSAQASNSEPKPADAAQPAKPQEDQKSRDLTPPEVPDENIRLVVNILAARECPSKTFSDTLDIIKHLSAIPGARSVFGKELVRQAQELGQTVQTDLEDLAKQINQAENSTDLQGLALASFSSGGSKQRMLLRVLLALDHLFDPARMPQGTQDTQVDPKLKEDVLALLYDSKTFELLWTNLSACLEAIRARGSMLNVATILLPLIESLMVVTRNSTLKDVPTSAAAASPAEVRASTPPPSASQMDTLFFRFTEDNRKILNELIRSNPKLMSGNLSILAKNSKVLEFDNKRTYFNRKLHNRGEVRAPHASLQLSVRREHVFLDSFKSLYYKNGDEIKYGKLNIRFHGEEGIDAGGVSREWFGAMARQMFNPDYALFTPVASDRTTFHPNELSTINSEHLLFFKFIGRIIGKALYQGQVLDCHFSRAVYRRILGKSVSLKDMESLDLEYYKSLVWLLENDITDIAFQTFSTDIDRFGASETIDLIPDGRNISVTEDNKHEYVQKIVEYRLITAVQDQLEKFLEGFHEIIPKELIAIFNEQELELLISGLPEIDVDDWKNNTEYHNYQPTSPQIQWFWRAVRSFDKEEKAKLLQFVTGTSKVPLNGFKELEGMNGFARFNIHRDYSSNQKLPSSHTCFNQLDLPEYETYEHMRQQMYTAITAGSEYFGFA